MPVTIQCPNPACGATSPVAESVSGRQVRCKRCGTPFVARPTLGGERSDTHPAGGPAGDPFPALPAEFGRYRVLRLLGRGGMGAVYLAEDARLGRAVALKIPSFTPGEAGRRAERFLREARAAAALHHPNICTVFDAGTEAGRPYITMAYVDGPPLDRLIAPGRPLPQAEAAGLVRRMALALAAAHAKGIVHRDLKPGNVLVAAGGEPVVTDFGLAKVLAEPATGEAKLTRDGALLGTPAYMAPEQVRGDTAAIGPRTDVYALGVILFELLTGRTPFEGPLTAVLGQVLAAPAPAPAAVRPDVDPRLDAACRRAMAKDPADRFPSMEAFAAALAEFLASPDRPADRPVPDPSPFGGLATEPARPVRARRAEPSTGDDAPQVRSRGHRSARRPKWPLLVAGGVLGLAALVAAVVLTVRTKHGDVVIELSDPAAAVEVKVDGGRVDLAGLDRPLSLAAGEHGLTVTGPDFETVTQSFTVKKGERQVVKVTLRPKAAAAGPARATAGAGAAPRSDPPPPAAGNWRPLFNGTDLGGWMSADGGPPDPKWEVRDGALSRAGERFGPSSRDVWTRERYGDFELELEYKTDGNSGVWVRTDVPADRVPEAIEVAIDRPAPAPSKQSTGALYGIAAPTREGARADDWNTMRVTARGTRIDVVLNGQAVLTADLGDWTAPGRNPDGSANRLKAALRDLKREGHIGFQAHNGTIAFRRVRVRRLDAPAGSAPAGPAAKAPPADAKALGGSAFKAYPDRLSWKAAKARCEELGGRLAVITSDEQNRFVTGLVTGAGLAEAWIGATDEAAEGAWVWVDGTPVGYANWDDGQPNNKMMAEHYALLWTGVGGRNRENGKWADQPDVSTQHRPGFVCEWVLPAAPAAGDGFAPLFNGKDLAGWKVVGDPRWAWKDGRLLGTPAPAGGPGFLVTEAEYDDFEVELRYRLAAGAGSGLFLRADPAGPATGAGKLEVQIIDDEFPRFAAERHKTGSVFGVFARQADPPLRRGDWNALRVRLVGRHIRVWVNGAQTVDADLDAARDRYAGAPWLARRSGRIALQSNQKADVEFRDVRVKPLGRVP